MDTITPHPDPLPTGWASSASLANYHAQLAHHYHDLYALTGNVECHELAIHSDQMRDYYSAIAASLYRRSTASL